MTYSLTVQRTPGVHKPRIRPALSKVTSAVAKVAKAAIRPHKAALVNLKEIPLTVAGAGLINAGIYEASTIAGLIVSGVTLLLIEHLIADDR